MVVTIDKEAEQAIVDRAFEGVPHIGLPTPGDYDRTDYVVSTADLTTFIVEVKDRDYTYKQLVDWGGPLVDSGKAAAVAERAADQDGRGIIVWRTNDGWLIGADVEDILVNGSEIPFKRERGNRSIDHQKMVYILEVGYCYVRPPGHLTNLQALDTMWVEWLAPSGPE